MRCLSDTFISMVQQNSYLLFSAFFVIKIIENISIIFLLNYYHLTILSIIRIILTVIDILYVRMIMEYRVIEVLNSTIDTYQTEKLLPIHSQK